MVDETAIVALDEAAKTGMMALAETNAFRKTFALAEAMGQLRGLLNPEVMKPFMNLQGTSLGFKTDRDSKDGYPLEVVRDCVIEATINGVSTVGNEFNIIAGRCYITKEGFGHKLNDFEGLSFTITPSVPGMKGGGAVVDMQIEWTLNGVAKEKVLSIPVKVNNGMGADAIIGKATRKARAWLWTAITGQELGEADASEEINITPKRKAERPVVEELVVEEVIDAEIVDDGAFSLKGMLISLNVPEGVALDYFKNVAQDALRVKESLSELSEPQRKFVIENCVAMCKLISAFADKGE